MSATETAVTKGVHHIGLTVPDLDRAVSFFIDKLGFAQVGAKEDYPAVFVSDGTIMITLWQVANPGNTAAFDRKSVIGLHHFALRVADHAALDDAHAKLASEKDVAIEFAPEPLGAGPARHMMLSIPGGIRMELISLDA